MTSGGMLLFFMQCISNPLRAFDSESPCSVIVLIQVTGWDGVVMHAFLCYEELACMGEERHFTFK